MRLSKQPHDGNCLRQDSVPLGSFVKFPRTAGQDKAEGNYYLYYPDPSSKEPLGLLEGQQMLRILTKAIDDLPKTERLVLTLLYFEELTLKETAAVLHMEERSNRFAHQCQYFDVSSGPLTAELQADAIVPIVFVLMQLREPPTLERKILRRRWRFALERSNSVREQALRTGSKF